MSAAACGEVAKRVGFGIGGLAQRKLRDPNSFEPIRCIDIGPVSERLLSVASKHFNVTCRCPSVVDSELLPIFGGPGRPVSPQRII